MATEYPPLGKAFVSSYSNNNREFPIIGIRKDPRIVSYEVPDDLSKCPDKRYPEHVFTGSSPIQNSDERVEWTYELLPSPWVPFTRYDDNLGPIQGRQRSVKSTGQAATLTVSQKTTFESRGGSSIVSTQKEENWDATLDNEGNSPFPILTSDSYDPQLGPVQVERQIFPFTGDETASLNYAAPIITETGFEAFNEYLTLKKVKTYSLNGPERREDLYDANRGDVQRVRQVIHDTGNLEGNLMVIGGNIRQTSYSPVNTLVVDRIVETSAVVGPSLDGSQTGKWGVGASESQIKASGTEAPSGFGIINGKVDPLNKDQSQESINRYPTPASENIIYTLNKEEEDEITKGIVSIENTLVNATYASTYAASKRADNWFVEVQPVDKWHSITISSKFTEPPEDTSWQELGRISLPDELLEIGVIWNKIITEEGSTGGVEVSNVLSEEAAWSATAKAGVTAAVTGGMFLKIKSGYNGVAQVNVTREFTFGAPSAPVTGVHFFNTVRGTVTIFGVSQNRKASSQRSGQGDLDFASSSFTTIGGDTTMQVQQFGPIEHDGVVLESAGDDPNAQRTATSTSGSIPAGNYPAASASVNITAEATMELPTSSIPLQSGDTFVQQVDVKPWKLGYWVKETYTATVPS